jgi:hypothetical protein
MEAHPDDTVPGGVYLCQVNDCVSCGACCGLYNVAEVSRTHLVALLRQRAQRFAALPRTAAAIDAFAQWTQAQESQKRPFPDFHHCPYIGLIGPNASRVGCLLHPLAENNQGVDFRGLSYYGGLACRTYFCPATKSLPARYKRILRTVLDDWYLYGLVVTETALIAAQFQWLEKRLGHELDAALFINHTKCASATRRPAGAQDQLAVQTARRINALPLFFYGPTPRSATDRLRPSWRRAVADAPHAARTGVRFWQHGRFARGGTAAANQTREDSSSVWGKLTHAVTGAFARIFALMPLTRASERLEPGWGFESQLFLRYRPAGLP